MLYVGVILVIPVIISQVNCLTCLHCDSVSQPRHCRSVSTCYAGEVCGVEKVTTNYGTLVYNVGCMHPSRCANGSVTNPSECTACCETDLCNSHGCGKPGYPESRGPICYSCAEYEDHRNCHSIDFCEQGEVCKIVSVREFGDVIFSSSCSSRHACEDPESSIPSPGLVGRDTDEFYKRAVVNRLCQRCCRNDLCNNDCNNTPQNTGTDECHSNPCIHGQCTAVMNNYTCQCNHGYTGRNCDTDINDCLPSPCIHGKCADRVNNYTCKCDIGYSGGNCYKDIDGCQRNACIHGKCVGDINNYTCQCHPGYSGRNCDIAVSDCLDIMKEGMGTTSGLYTIITWKSQTLLKVFCDMDTEGGGWTVFQRRYNGTIDFYRNFVNYTDGFGRPDGEFWLGLKYIYEMTSQRPSLLRIDMMAADLSKAFEVYQNFSLSPPSDFTLHIGKRVEKSGIITSSDFSTHDQANFSTFDHDNDMDHSDNCAVDRHGGWWYFSCANVNLNGRYVTPGTTAQDASGAGGMVHYGFKLNTSLKSSKMMFKRIEN